MRAVVQGIILLFGFLFAFAGTVQADSCAKPVGRLVSLQGKVEARAPEQTTWRAARLDDRFCPGDALRTGARSRAALVLANETIVRLDQLTTLTLSGLDDQATSWVDLLHGAAHFLSRTPRALKVKTPYVNAGVEGTEFVVRADRDEGSVTVLEGRVRADNPQGVVVLGGGESAAARAGQAPATRLVARPRDAVQWSLYYPPLFDPNALTAADWTESARRSADAYLAGDSAGAFAAIDAVPENVADARFFNYRAGLLLSVGRVDEAQADIARALGLAAEDAHAQALQSIVALARNDKPAALDLARKANARDPESAPAWIALSYAQQAAFDLEGARASVEQALRRDPRNVLVMARLSELWLSLGDLDRAVETANRAVALNPNIARTQTVLGFAYLTQIKTADAKQAFEKAIGLDSADPLPRLGLGLALIRTGELEAGRREIEIAAALDPNNALIRSYLGKAYYEEKRNRLAAAQLDMARQLDPNDPTPWFYDAIRKQTENRPVEALQDLQKSIELNDNRAVYRSRLQLDQDLAARSASLARIYQDLGFQQRALVEGWHSVNTDPSNYSAHRFLSDAYAGRPRYNIARSSELLQAQLLQPLNLNPLQPQLTEGGTYIPAGLLSGPSASGYNEHNSLFTRERITAQVNTLAGSNETYGAEAVISGLTSNISYSVGAFDYSTEGSRPNNSLDQTVYDGIVQAALSPALSVQAEVRSLSRDNGDLRRLFDPANFSSVRSEELTTKSLRLGLRYQLSPASDMVVSLQSQVRDSRVYDSVTTSSIVPPTTTTSTLTTESTGDIDNRLSEIQHLYRSSTYNIVSGAGYFDGSVDNRVTGTISSIVEPTCTLFPFLCPFVTPVNIVDATDTRHTTAYSYANVRTSAELIWTLGLSADFISNNVVDENRLNPKLGLTWTPEPMTTLRAAAFRATKRDLVTDQTIEPTQVAGFNQFYDDQNSADIWHYGIGLDHRATAVLSGIEFSMRDLEVPKEDTTTGIVSFHTWDEQQGRAYLYWTLGPKFVVSAEYLYELAKRPEDVSVDGILNLRTHRVPLGLGFFHPSGFVWNVRATYLNQTGSFVDATSNPHIYSDGKEKVWLMDTEVGYRLPRRYGFLAIGVKNLFDTAFRFQDTDPANPSFVYNRVVYGRMNLSF
ncbi:MAG TPA: FecR domain-containing protein [Acidiferrobacterales bacterium]|nr:FecR domain-containing protein [Acidiferrobacterales bacterium]